MICYNVMIAVDMVLTLTHPATVLQICQEKCSLCCSECGLLDNKLNLTIFIANVTWRWKNELFEGCEEQQNIFITSQPSLYFELIY